MTNQDQQSAPIVLCRVGAATIEDTRALDIEAFALFMLLLAVNGRHDFHLSTELRHLMPGGWPLRRFVKAANRLIDGGFIMQFELKAQSTVHGEHVTVQ